MNTNDTNLLFQADDAHERYQRRQEKRQNKEGSPILLPSNPLDLVVRGNEAFIAQNGFIACSVDLSTGKTRATFRGHKGPVCALALHRVSGRLLLISGSWDKSIRVWDAETAELLSTIDNAHADFVKTLLVIPELELLVSGGSDKDVRLWDIADGIPRPLTTLKAHTRPVECFSYHCIPDSSDVALWCADSMGKICVWKVSVSRHDAYRITIEKVCEWRHHETAVYDLAVDVERKQVWTASADKFAILCSFDPSKPEVPPTVLLRIEHPYFVKTLLLYEDFLLTGSTDEGIRVWDVAALTASADGAKVDKTLASAGWKEAAKPSDKTQSDLGLVRHLDVHAHEVNRLVLWTRVTEQNDLEPWLISASLDGTVRTWKLADLLKPASADPPVVSEPKEETGMTAEEEAELEALMADD